MRSRKAVADELSRIDRVIHEPARLGILSMLASNERLSFTELKGYLGLTDGNLSVHLRVLEENGYVETVRKFVRRKPRTTVRLSARGRRSFRNYLTRLERIVAGGRPD